MTEEQIHDMAHELHALLTRILDHEQQSPRPAGLIRELRALGERIYKIGGAELMLAAAKRVCDPRDGGRSASVVDHYWDGIGADEDDPQGWREGLFEQYDWKRRTR